jgi:hypothetical protein
MIDAEKSDVSMYWPFALPPITRLDRVQERRATIISNYDPKLLGVP